MDAQLEIFLVAPPGLELALCEEARAAGFSEATAEPGGVFFRGDWPDVWRANLTLRGAGRVLVRIAAFRALHLAQLDKRARRVPWAELLGPGRAVRVEATCRGSRIYHDRAAAERIARAARDALGPGLGEPLRILARIEDDLCTLSIDSSGGPLHQRGHKQAVGKAPLRETLAALFLWQCGYRGTEPVADPMCGSGTFVLEAAEIAAGLLPGRSRAFAFEQLASFEPALWDRLREAKAGATHLRFMGADRDAGAVRASLANAERAGVAGVVDFRRQPISEFSPPEGPRGLVMVNPPYGGRIGAAGPLRALYGTLGQVLRSRFAGWRVGIVTSEATLARATELPFLAPSPPVPHGGLKVRLYRTDALP